MSKVLNYFDGAKWNRERRGVDKFTEDRADGVCWTYTITHTHTHTIVYTDTQHTGDIIAACQVCGWWPAVWH